MHENDSVWDFIGALMNDSIMRMTMMDLSMNFDSNSGDNGEIVQNVPNLAEQGLLTD